MPGGYAVVVQSGDTCRVVPNETLVTQLTRLRGVVSVVRS
jgi:hypothetical protein